LDWTERNLNLNAQHGSKHALVRADCQKWLAAARAKRERFGLIFLDPPTFSNSKRTHTVLDVQRDHAALADACAPLLAPGGLLLFSTNAQRFRLDESLRERFTVCDISADTLPADFARNSRIHRCFELRAS